MESALAYPLAGAVLMWVCSFGDLVPIHPCCALNETARVR